MDLRYLCCWLFGENYKYWIAVFNAVKTAEPGNNAASGLNGIFITGFGLTVCAFEMFPLKVIRSRYDASV